MSHRRISPVRRLPVAPGKPYPPWCWIHERRLVYRARLLGLSEIDRDGTRCHMACPDEEAQRVGRTRSFKA